MSSTLNDAIPAYGILLKDKVGSEVDAAVEQIANLGYAVIPSGYSDATIASIASAFDRVHEKYVHYYGEERLRSIDEYNGIRLPLAFDRSFMHLVMNEMVLDVIAKLIQGKFILNQQNGIINPAGQKYNQGAWHRDLPYQHFVSSRPIAINALYCVDEFTKENGATYVLPASHKREAFPSDQFILNNQVQIAAPVGSFIVIDCMTYHRGGFNASPARRRAVNHVYTIPYIKQQIELSGIVENGEFNEAEAEMLGYRYKLPCSIEDFLAFRK